MIKTYTYVVIQTNFTKILQIICTSPIKTLNKDS